MVWKDAQISGCRMERARRLEVDIPLEELACSRVVDLL